MSKHTPGPWKDYGDCVGSKAGRICNLIHTMEHNSALIAAAPTMLEALERIISEWKKGTYCPEWFLKNSGAIEAIKAAKGKHDNDAED